MPLSPGSRLGPYDITATLGAGGMGEVYRGHDSRLNRDAAIKVLPAAFATDPARMARFTREAQMLAALSHPNIAGLYGLEESGGAAALVMELVEGVTLAERIALGPIPLAEALAIARQIADALEAAHEKGIIHRDLKPANIKITPDGKVKVLDFGLAKALDPDPMSGAANPANSPTLTLDSTRAGQIMGTAGYMSPEQARGKPVDKRADIWAFGVVLHEMLTGRSTFEGDTVSDILAAVLRADLEWKYLPPDTPPKVRRLLQRCLERDPKRRLRDIADAWIEMETPDEPAVAAPPPAPPLSAFARWLPWAVAAVLGLAGVAWGWLHTTSAAPEPVTRWTLSQKGFWGFVNMSRDGTRLAYTEGALSNLHIVLRMLDQFEGKPVNGTDSGFFPVFSPDGQWILFSTPQGKLKKIPATGGTSITLCDGSTTIGASWGDDDNIVFPGGKGLMRVPASGGTPEQLTKVDSKNGEIQHVYPQFVPGADKVVFTIGTGAGYDTAQIAVLDLKTRSYKVVAKGGTGGRFVPSGHLAYLRGGTLYAVPFDLKRMIATGPEAPAIEGMSGVGPPGYADYSFSESGLLVYITGTGGSQQGTTLAWADRKGAIEPITTTQQLWGTGRLSPDGTRIANALTRQGSESEIWVYEIARGTLVRLSFEGGSDNPVWSPDGRRVVFGSVHGGNRAIYSVAADGSGKPELLLTTDKRPIPTSFTPDGKTLVFTQARADQTNHILSLSLASAGAPAQPHPLHDSSFSESGGQVSPDGRWLAYESLESGGVEVYVQPFPSPGAKVRISTQGGQWPRWARNGRELYFWEGNPPASRLVAVEVQTSPAFQVGSSQLVFPQGSGTTWDVAPDGKRFLVEMTQLNDTTGSKMAAVTGWFDELRRRAPARK